MEALSISDARRIARMQCRYRPWLEEVEAAALLALAEARAAGLEPEQTERAVKRAAWREYARQKSWHRRHWPEEYAPAPCRHNQAAESAGDWELVSRAIDGLPPRQKEAVALMLDGHTCTSAAEIMGIRPRTVADYIEYAVRNIRQWLRAHSLILWAHSNADVRVH